jgi:hypothetical protein
MHKTVHCRSPSQRQGARTKDSAVSSRIWLAVNFHGSGLNLSPSFPNVWS